jgi:hypothetical protein
MTSTICAGCHSEMTPENSKIMPELFLCDACASKPGGPARPLSDGDKRRIADVRAFAEANVLSTPIEKMEQDEIRHCMVRETSILFVIVQRPGCKAERILSLFAFMQGPLVELVEVAELLEHYGFRIKYSASMSIANFEQALRDSCIRVDSPTPDFAVFTQSCNP